MPAFVIVSVQAHFNAMDAQRFRCGNVAKVKQISIKCLEQCCAGRDVNLITTEMSGAVSGMQKYVAKYWIRAVNFDFAIRTQMKRILIG